LDTGDHTAFAASSFVSTCDLRMTLSGGSHPVTGLSPPNLADLYLLWGNLSFSHHLFSHTHFILVYSSPFIPSAILVFFLRSATHVCGLVSFLSWRAFVFLGECTGSLLFTVSLSFYSFPFVCGGHVTHSFSSLPGLSYFCVLFLNQLVVDGLVIWRAVKTQTVCPFGITTRD
jgi:hypothetical protein